MLVKKWQEILKTDVKFQKMKGLGEKFQASAPAPFVGRYGYPHVNVGLLCPPEQGQHTWQYDAPRYWHHENYGTNEVVGFRGALVNSQVKTKVHEPVEFAQLTALAMRPVDVEVQLKKKPHWSLATDDVAAPTGPSAELSKIKLTSNAKIPTKVDKVVHDELKSVEQIETLYNAGFDEHYLSRILSVGTLGLAKKLVPTRWSITATDDMLAKHVLKNLKEQSTADYQMYYGSYLGNHYLVMMLPERWQYELFEMMLPAKQRLEVSTDYEGFRGRSRYAENCTGGYYSVRLAITEKLAELKRQASVLVFRFVTPAYDTPLGVWVTREATRHALSQQAIGFPNKESMLAYAKRLVQEHHGFDLGELFNHSKILKETQMNLLSF
ncbi:hypothetical protein CMO91_04045 [Candidatus Woesearchaeota archaeon]|nr:hypothetical protein [Candidatus Woesearchaeota archaeon]